jgi:hypothetical protein
MRLIISILLVPLVLASQTLCAVHVHFGMTVADLVDHASRPHFHVVTQHNHRHVHHDVDAHDGSPDDRSQSACPPMQDTPDHEFDAFGCPDLAFVDGKVDATSTLSILIAWMTVDFIPIAAQPADAMSATCPHQASSPCGSARIPLYVRNASYRC